jgi:hypothetical protein
MSANTYDGQPVQMPIAQPVAGVPYGGGMPIAVAYPGGHGGNCQVMPTAMPTATAYPQPSYPQAYPQQAAYATPYPAQAAYPYPSNPPSPPVDEIRGKAE